MSGLGVIGRYRLLKKLAAGGMAEIFLARQEGPAGFAKTVVVKRMLSHLSESRDFIDMFLDEARLAALLSHPNVVQVFDFGEAEGVYYLAMEYLAGEDLGALRKLARRAGTPVQPDVAAKVIADACEGLHYAHFLTDEHGRAFRIVHRDVSPSNIIVTYQGTVKVLDFGIAKMEGKAQQTRAGVVKGKYRYMSPEQIRGRELDPRSDVFSIGTVLHEMLTGKRLFEGENEHEIMRSLLKRPIPAPSEIRPSVPSSLDQIVLQALQRDPAERFQSALEMRRALEGFLMETSLAVSADVVRDYLRELAGERRIEASLRLGRGESSAIMSPLSFTSQGDTPSPKPKGAAESSLGSSPTPPLDTTQAESLFSDSDDPRAGHGATDSSPPGEQPLAPRSRPAFERPHRSPFGEQQESADDPWPVEVPGSDPGGTPLGGMELDLDRGRQYRPDPPPSRRPAGGEDPSSDILSMRSRPRSTGAAAPRIGPAWYDWRWLSFGGAALVAAVAVVATVLPGETEDEEEMLPGGQTLSVLSIESSPEGARVLLNEDDTGQMTPATLRVLPAEHRTVTLRHPECLEERISIPTERGTMQEPARLYAELEPGARISLKSVPEGAKATVLGEGETTTPGNLDHALAPGSYEVELELAGHVPKRLDLEILEAEPVTLHAELEAGIEVRVSSHPSGAEIRVGGEPTDETTPATLILPAESRHAIAVRKAGYDPAWVRVPSLEEGEREEVHLELEHIERSRVLEQLEEAEQELERLEGELATIEREQGGFLIDTTAREEIARRRSAAEVERRVSRAQQRMDELLDELARIDEELGY